MDFDTKLLDRGRTELFTSAAALMAWLTKAHTDGAIDATPLPLAEVKPLAPDELGYRRRKAATRLQFFLRASCGHTSVPAC